MTVHKGSHCGDIQIRQKRMSRTFPKQKNILGEENSIEELDLWTVVIDSWAAKCLEQLDIGHIVFQEVRLEMRVGTRLMVLCRMA